MKRTRHAGATPVLIFLLVLFGAALASCDSTEPIPTPTAIATVKPDPTLTPTATSTVTVTATSTETPKPLITIPAVTTAVPTVPRPVPSAISTP